MLIHGDCLQELKKLDADSVDLVVTDPPYNMDYGGRGEINKLDKFANDNMEAEEHSKWFTKIVKECHRVLKEDTAIYVFIDFRNYARIYNVIGEYFDIKNCIVWNKNSIGMGKCFRFQHEFIIYAQKGKPQLDFKGRGISDVWSIDRDLRSDYTHPTQKPRSVMYKPVEYSSKEGDLVLDPFVGSGTTGIVCKELNRRFIGMEIAKKYYDIAEKRITNTIKPLL